MTARPNPLHDGIDLDAEAFRSVELIETRPSGFYRPHPDGKLACIIPVHDHAGGLIDIVAYEHHQPGRWWLRTGLGDALGENVLDLARWHKLTVCLVDTPHDWLCSRVPLIACVLKRDQSRSILAGINVIKPNKERLRHAA